MTGPFSAGAGSERLGIVAIVGMLAVPLLTGGVLTWALATPTAHLDRVTAAIVNDDEPVTVDGSTVPLGRQLAAGLMGGGTPDGDTPEHDPQNFTWVLTNDDEATAGLRNGRYVAVVTIPASFSASATSMGGPAASAVHAEIEVTTTPASAALDPALTEAVTSTAVASMNAQLISQYLGNVYEGFNTIEQQISDAASGASSLAAGAVSLADGAATLASGAAQLAAGLGALDTGSDSLAAGLAELDAAAQGLPEAAALLAQGAAEVSSALDTVASKLDGATTEFSAVVAEICALPGPGTVCGRATGALGTLQTANRDVATLASGADQVAAGAEELAAGMTALVGGLDASAEGADEVAAGADASNAGAASLATGAASLVTGADQVETGAAQLADGLEQAAEQLPSYSDSDIEILSSVVSQPVNVTQFSPAAGWQTVPLYAVVALWVGGIVLALARQAVPRRRLLTATSSGRIALQAMLPGVAIGAVQGLVVGVAFLVAVAVDPGQGLGFTAAAVAVGAVFAAVNQGLAASFGAVGRLAAAFVGAIALAAGLSSTVPPAVDSLAAAFPTTPGLELLLATLTAGTVWAALTGLVLFALLGVALVFAGVAARRTVRVSR
ncbi:hypothetical protein [Agromyces laixinhei]|uniref:hypothetical protein n=1 Tax=Agromyces laixinhei TaxID=2585717 RepID=UPI0012ED979D|nr:hypothetical protein [Agromyces laixinhei]